VPSHVPLVVIRASTEPNELPRDAINRQTLTISSLSQTPAGWLLIKWSIPMSLQALHSISVRFDSAEPSQEPATSIGPDRVSGHAQ